MPKTGPMTTATFAEDWAAHPVGKATRALVAIVGIVLSTLVLLLATMSSGGAWMFALLGVVLAATSIRAAMQPSVLRLGTLAIVMIAIPVLGQVL